MMEWQPIETAPKDEMLLLAGELDGPGDWRIKIGYWDEDLQRFKIFGASWEPSRWMPLPDPPH